MEQEDVTPSALRAMLPEEESAELPRLARAFLDFFRLPDLLDFRAFLGWTSSTCFEVDASSEREGAVSIASIKSESQELASESRSAPSWGRGIVGN